MGQRHPTPVNPHTPGARGRDSQRLTTDAARELLQDAHERLEPRACRPALATLPLRSQVLSTIALRSDRHKLQRKVAYDLGQRSRAHRTWLLALAGRRS